jgi:hypothetical protein
MNSIKKQPVKPVSLGHRMLQGAAIGLALISAFLFMAGEGDPGWHRFWMLRPLLVVTAAGATAGAIYYSMHGWRARGGWVKAAAVTAGVLVYVVGLWMGSVLGLDGTYWN